MDTALSAGVIVLLLIFAALLLLAFLLFSQSLPEAPIHITYRPHAVERHGDEARLARKIGEDPNSQCQHFICNSSVTPSLLRICSSPSFSGLYAIQWLHPTSDHSFEEGTSFLKRGFHKVLRYLIRNGCTQVQ